MAVVSTVPIISPFSGGCKHCVTSPHTGGCPHVIHGLAEHKKATFTSLFGTPVRDVSAVIMVGARGGLVFSAVAKERCEMVQVSGCTSVATIHVGPVGRPANMGCWGRPYTYKKSLQPRRFLALRFPVQLLCGRVTFRPRLPCHSPRRSCGQVARSCGQILPQLRKRGHLLSLSTERSNLYWSSLAESAFRGLMWDTVSLCCWESSKNANP